MKSTAPQLQEFVDAAKNHGAADEVLANLLIREGWSSSQVHSALGNHWERITGLPVPSRITRSENARDAFLYLLSFLTLATSACAIGSILFHLIDHWLPDPVSRFQDYALRAGLTWQIASAAVAFPIYLMVMRAIVRETAAEPERLQSSVRKWLTWLALLIAAGTIIGDLITFLDYFLTGELTIRFVLKCTSVFAIAGAIFSYYLASLRGKSLPTRAFALGSAAAVTALVITGLAVVGTPPVQRKLQADTRRVEDLRGIANAVHAFWTRNHQLPIGLNDPQIQQWFGGHAPADPETSAAYEYHLRPDSHIEICAVFNYASANTTGAWNHPQGRGCFVRDAKLDALP